MKSERQPPGLPLVEWLALFLEKLAHLRRLGRIYEGRPCEAVDYFIATIISPIYGEFIRQFLSEYYDDATRTMANLSNYVGQRAWTYEQGIGLPRRGGLNAVDTEESDTTADLAALAPAAAAGRKPVPKQQAGAPNLPVTTTIDVSLYNKKTLKDLGLKLVSIQDNNNKTDKKPRAQTSGIVYAYCWSHGSFPAGHRGHHTGHECDNPKNGHRADATEGNHMGGSSKVYKLG